MPAYRNVPERIGSHGTKASAGLAWLLLSGASRSGTTFLNVLLNTHPRIALFTESGIDEIVSGVHRCLSAGKIISGSRGAPVPYTPAPEITDRVVRALFESRFGKTDLAFVGDKMPNVDAHILSRYEGCVSSLKKIYIVRRPSEVIPSSLKRRDSTRLGADSWHVTSVVDAIIEWAGNWEHAAASHDRGDTLVVSYERFERDMAGEIARLAAFLDVDEAGFSTLCFTKERDDRYAPTEDEAGAIRDILGLIEDGLAQNLEDALATMPRVYPKVALGTHIVLNARWPYAGLVFKTGFSILEDWGIWTDGHVALMGFRVDPAPPRVRVSLCLTAFMGHRPHFELLVRCNAQPELQRFRIEPDTNRVSIRLDCAPGKDGLVELHLQMPSIKTADEEPTFDPRGLGVGLFSFAVEAND